MDESYLAGKTSKERGFLHRCIPAADNGDRFAREKKAVAGRARGNAMADQSLLIGQAQPTCRCATRNDQRLSLESLFAQIDGEGPPREIRAHDMSSTVFRTEARGLLLHVLD